MKNVRILMALAALATLAGCTTYYEVTDPTTGKTYYSTDIDKNKDGTVQLVVEGSDTEVTIQNSEVREISKDEFKAAAYKPVAQPAPAPAPAPEAAPAEAAPAE